MIDYLLDIDGVELKKATVEAATEIMIPGGSEHNAGLAMDICSLSESFEDTDEFAWLSENAADFGFILRYPENKESITSITADNSVYRYVGKENAVNMRSYNMCLEEYCNYLEVQQSNSK